MVSFKVVYRCNTCNKDLVTFGGFNNLTEIGRIQIPIDQVMCNDCNTNNRCIVLVGPGQPEYERDLASITLHEATILCGTGGRQWIPSIEDSRGEV